MHYIQALEQSSSKNLKIIHVSHEELTTKVNNITGLILLTFY